MENSEAQSTPMGRVWFIVLLTMCLTFGASWIWHVSGINEEVARNKAVNDVVSRNTAEITQYRDVLRESGKDAAMEYLATSSPNFYGN